jgi:tryptophan halogenase
MRVPSPTSHLPSEPIRSVVVLGDGIAGLLTALTIKRRLPDLAVEMISSNDNGGNDVIMNGGSSASLPIFLHGVLGFDPVTFHRQVQPTYKLGTRYLWGPRGRFHSTFTGQLDQHLPRLPRPNGYYCHDEFDYADVASAMMAHGKAFDRQPTGAPVVPPHAGYHIQGDRFVKFLQVAAAEAGVTLTEDSLENAVPGEHGIASLQLKSGRIVAADLFVDCSGTRSDLLRGTLAEEFVAFERSLFPDRAIVGGWARTDEALNAFSTAETMNAGWAWQVEHDAMVQRGYVYFSHFLSDDEAEKEFRDKNPQLGEVRVVPFQSGRCRRSWVGNVVALGDAAGFVEPLESTAITTITDHATLLVSCLRDSDRRILASQIGLYNRRCEADWEEIRRFLALHYKFNTRLETPFWKACHDYTDLAGAEAVIEQYREVGPSQLCAGQLIESRFFGLEGYLAMLVGMAVPCSSRYQPSESDLQIWNQIRAEFATRAQASLTQEEGLRYLRSAGWQWRPEFYLELATRRYGSGAANFVTG